jgi:NADPH-dependent curcumin reductase CurA
MPTTNRQIRLAARPQGEIRPSDWEHRSEESRDPAEGEFAGRTKLVSLDPAMRGWLDDRPSYIPPVGLGDVMRAGTIVEVTESRHPGFAVGDHVVGMFGVQERIVSDGAGAMKVDAALAPLPTYLGALGMTGMTAYFGLVDVGAVEAGNTVVVSGAAGAVGSVVGQIAKIKECRVVGLAGGEAKCRMVTEELGFDACIDYRAGDVRAALRRECPDGIDVYFDNVGGEILDAALANIALHARVVICGAISQYNATSPPPGPANYLALLVRRARMEGFIVFDFASRYPEAAAELAGWLRDGKLRSPEHIVPGTIDDFPETLHMLFRGENVGKLILELQG